MEKLLDLNLNELDKYSLVNDKEIQNLLDNEIKQNKHKIVVLDDDPTGVQTVHDISVYTDWSYDTIRSGFEETNQMFFILTNSRSFSVEQTTKIHKEIGERVARVGKELNQSYLIISRSDSTLRGHYPLETELLREELEKSTDSNIDGEVLCYYFKEGGRYTINDVHYVRYGEKLIPAGQTEFAKDKTFGFSSSNLCDYIEEKTKGKYLSEDVITISLDELRSLSFKSIEQKLLDINNFNKVVVNAIDASDIKVFCIALYRAIAKNKNFLFRTSAGFVKELSGVSYKPLLNAEEMIQGNKNAGGIVVVGSHTAKTTTQLENMFDLEGLKFIEFNSDLVLEEGRLEEEVKKVVEQEEEFIKNGTTVVVYTKRKVLTFDNDTEEEALRRSVKISEAVQELVGRLTVTPKFVVAKGGITSSDIGTKALQVKRANVLGQIKPGIPVWQTGKESKFPNIPYIIFPGNVGDDKTLKEVVEKLL